jgi:hypothetical protein
MIFSSGLGSSLVHIITILDPQMKELIQSGGDIQVWEAL